MRTSHPWHLAAALALLLAVLSVLALGCGALMLSPLGVLRALAGDDPLLRSILLELRLPRVLTGILVGAALATSGAILQCVMRNDLASPGLLGVSSGGGLAGVAVLLLFPACPGLLVPAAFSGALAAAAAIYLLAWKQGIDPVRLILSGVALSAFFGALANVILLFNADRAGSVLDFAIGSLAGCTGAALPLLAVLTLAGLLGAWCLRRELDVLALGDESAASLGLPIEWVRGSLLVLSALLAAAAVSVAGLLGFVGLIAPHAARRLVGAVHARMLPVAALLGALLVVICDAVGRSLLAPSELPAGLLLALLGPPFFLHLLRRRGRYDV